MRATGEKNMITLKLVKPSIEIESSYDAYISEWEASGEEIVPLASSRTGRSFIELLKFWEENTTEKAYEMGWVPSTLYFLVDDAGEIYGASHIRHELNDYLFQVGGHVGYGIRPSERKNGYASKMLRLTLPLARQLGIGKLLVTCDKSNTASARTILNNGGILENEVRYEGETVQRYWIGLSVRVLDADGCK